MLRPRRPRSLPHALRRLAAAVLAGLALVLAVRPAPPPAAADAEQDVVPVVVAADDLAPGTVLTEQHLAVARLPPDAVPAGVAAEPGSLAGRSLAGAVRSGEPITDVRLAGSALTAALPAGQVAAPVRLADVAVAAQLRAGDRVDVLATVEGAEVAAVVAPAALVLLAPGAVDSADDGALWLAASPEVAARLAAASTRATLTVSLVGA
jgi:pilus assembly protein CpaB